VLFRCTACARDHVAQPPACACGGSTFAAIPLGLSDDEPPNTKREPGQALTFSTFMLSCPERRAVLDATRRSLAVSGWSDVPAVVLDDQGGPTSMERLNLVWRRVITQAGAARTDFVLLLEDDLVFGRWFPENLRTWPVLQGRPAHFWGSLYNHGRGQLRRDGERHSVADPAFVWGAQALVMTPLTARFIAEHWFKAAGNADVRMARLGADVSPLYYHFPSLVDHAAVPSTWCAETHRAVDFDPDWRQP
jgi:hypothetical protein